MRIILKILVGLQVAVVTFSGQTALIRTVIGMALAGLGLGDGSNGGTTDFITPTSSGVSSIIYRGDDGSWESPDDSLERKQVRLPRWARTQQAHYPNDC